MGSATTCTNSCTRSDEDARELELATAHAVVETGICTGGRTTYPDFGETVDAVDFGDEGGDTTLGTCFGCTTLYRPMMKAHDRKLKCEAIKL